MKGFATQAIHGDLRRNDPHGTLRPAVYDNVAFEFADAHSIQLAFEGRSPAHTYARVSNPTVEEFEQRIRLLSDALGVVAVSSGMAAISAVLLALGSAGSKIVTTKWVFGNTYSLFEHTLKPWGLDVDYLDLSDLDAVAAALDERTSAIFLEVITNPQLQVVDIDSIVRLAQERGVPVVLDGTLTTPYLFRSKDHGVAIEVISSTKYISGGATTMGGLIVDNGIFDWKRSANAKLQAAARKFGSGAFLNSLRREVCRNTGGCLSPHNAYLQTLGLETLSLRIDRSTANALQIARWLEKQPKVAAVNYPSLESSPDFAVAQRLFPRGCGGIVTLDLATREQCSVFQNALQLIRRATNVNDNKTLILHPGSTIFCEYSAEEKAAMGVRDTMLRLSVGIEDVDDILEDMQRGLEAL